MRKKNWVPAYNCNFHLAKGGKLRLENVSLNFTQEDYQKTMDMAVLHAEIKKLKKPDVHNKWWMIPVLREAI